MAKKNVVPPVPDSRQVAEDDRAAAHAAQIAALEVIKAAEGIVDPPEAKTKAQEAKTKAQEVEGFANQADVAWRASVAELDDTAVKQPAGRARVARVEAESALDAATRLLAEAKRLEGAKKAEEAEVTAAIEAAITEATSIREGIGTQLVSIGEDVTGATTAHQTTPTTKSWSAYEAAVEAEKAVERAYNTAKKAESSAKRAKTKEAAEKALEQAKEAKAESEAAVLEAGDAVRVITTSAKRKAGTQLPTAQKARDKAKAGFFNWLKANWSIPAATAIGLVLTVIALFVGLRWVDTRLGVTTIIFVTLGVAVLAVIKMSAAKTLSAAFAVVGVFALFVALTFGGGNAVEEKPASGNGGDQDTTSQCDAGNPRADRCTYEELIEFGFTEEQAKSIMGRP